MAACAKSGRATVPEGREIGQWSSCLPRRVTQLGPQAMATTPSNALDPLIDTLVERVVEGVVARLEEARAAPPVLLDRSELARALGISLSQLHKLRELGCPTVWIVEAPRFELAAVLDWLRAGNGARAKYLQRKDLESKRTTAAGRSTPVPPLCIRNENEQTNDSGPTEDAGPDCRWQRRCPP